MCWFLKSFIESIVCPEYGEFTVRGSTVLAVCVGSLKHVLENCVLNMSERFHCICILETRLVVCVILILHHHNQIWGYEKLGHSGHNDSVVRF